MSYTLGVIREFHTANFDVIVDALPENDLDLSWDDTGEVAQKLDSGMYIAFVARCRVLYHGMELGADYLGGCVYESFDAFMDHRECGKQNAEYARNGEVGRCGSYFHQMINEACKEARKSLVAAQSVMVRGA